MSTEEYYYKYCKYKSKYNEFKISTQIGGSNPIIIHISGPQGSGKSTLGKRISDQYGDLVVVKDLDDLWDDFNMQNKITNYQDYIDEFINEHSDKPLIITGLSAEQCLYEMNNIDKTFYQINTDHKYYISMDDNTVLKQRFFRQIDKLSNRREMLFENWLKNSKKTQDKINRYVNLSQWKDNNIHCRKIHIKYGYKLMDQESIAKEVSKILYPRSGQR